MHDGHHGNGTTPGHPAGQTTHFPVIVVGGGQAGLAMSYCLKERGIDHVIFERHRLGQAWRAERWDSFCLVTPNWQCQLPGFPYPGPDPDGFMVQAEIVRYLEDYARSFGPPLREGVTVARLGRENAATGGRFTVATTDGGNFTADQVVVATGGYHVATVPRMAERFPAGMMQMHSSAYKNPATLPPGAVLVVGTGQRAGPPAPPRPRPGRQPPLGGARATRVARRYRGRDVVAWLHDMGHYDLPVHDHPMRERVRAKANQYVTGRDGGRDLDLRKFAREGMRLYGRLLDVRGSRLEFRDDLKANLDAADASSAKTKAAIDQHIAAHGLDAPTEPPYRPWWEPPSGPDAWCRELDYAAAGITAVIWSLGYRTDYRWVSLPVFDGSGYPTHQRGVTSAPGLYFLGLPWQYTWGSGRFSGVARDARYLADRVAETARHGSSRATTDEVAAVAAMNFQDNASLEEFANAR